MGVQGLYTFVTDNSGQLLSPYQLQGSKLVIDGGNMMYALYSRLEGRFGGDYDLLERNIRNFFVNLKRHNIVPYVIFDGTDPDKSKQQRILKRAEDRLKRVKKIALGTDRGNMILPILAWEVFVDVLVELFGFSNHAICDFEADEEVAALANALDCPVLSSDSDFFIFNVRRGVIPFDPKINHRLCRFTVGLKPASAELKVKAFCIDNLLKRFPNLNTNSNIFPLISVMLGNDYITTGSLKAVVNALIRSIHIKRDSNWKEIDKHIGKLRCMYWLNQQPNLETATNKILQRMKADQRSIFEDIILKVVDTYCNPQTSLVEYFEAGKIGKSLLQMSDKIPLPNWFMLKLRQGMISTSALHVLQTRSRIFQTSVESYAHESVMNAGKPIRKVMYKIILGLREKEQGVTLGVEEFDRSTDGCNMISTILNTSDDDSFGSDRYVPSLANLGEMPIEERLKTLLQALFIPESLYKEVLDKIPQPLLLPVFVLKYCTDKAVPVLESEIMDAIIVCLLNLHYTATRKQEVKKCGREITLLHMPPKFTVAVPYDCSIIHGLSQFQACLLNAAELNQLLLCPLVAPKMAQLINGTFVYNLHYTLKNNPNPKLYIENLLQGSDVIHITFQMIKRTLGQKCD